MNKIGHHIMSNQTWDRINDWPILFYIHSYVKGDIWISQGLQIYLFLNILIINVINKQINKHALISKS